MCIKIVRKGNIISFSDTIKKLAITEDNALSSKIYIDGSIKDEKDIGISKKVKYIKEDKEMDDREYKVFSLPMRKKWPVIKF